MKMKTKPLPAFHKIVETLKNNPNLVIIDDYDDYHKIKEAGLEQFTEEEINNFIDVVLDERTATNFATDEKCEFENKTFENHGLYVWMMWGQGVAYTIRNKPEEN